jgi:cytosine/adenosine deaminase-related metal-dependent hydrolase
LLTAGQVHVHCNTLDPDEFALLAEAGAAVSCSPETELNMGMGRLAIDACLQHDIPPTLSCDIVSLNSGDLFAQLRLAIAYQRSVDNDGAHRAGAMPERLAVRAADALRWAAPNGADALGLGDVVGSITPGKEADVIVVGGPGIAAGPVIEPEATLVFQGSTAAVRHVLVAGEFVKRDGELVDQDPATLRRAVDASAQGILDRMHAVSPTLPPPPAFGPEVIEALAEANFGER